MEKLRKRDWQYLLLTVAALALAALACNYDLTVETPTRPPTETDTNALRSGEVLEAPSGVTLGAVEGALPGQVGVTIELFDSPELPDMPPHVVQVGFPQRITVDQDLVMGSEKPLVIGLPVAEGLEVEHLALAMLVDPESVDAVPGLHGDRILQDRAVESFWEVIPGRYDPENQLFLTTLHSLPDDGRTVVLVSGEAYSSPAAARPKDGGGVLAQASGISFEAVCVPAGGDSAGGGLPPYTACTEAKQNQLESYAMQAYTRFVQDAGFEPPRLRREIESISVSPPEVTFSNTYLVEIRQPQEVDADKDEEDKRDPGRCKYTMKEDGSGRIDGPLSGVYMFDPMTFAVCLAEASSPHFDPGDKTDFQASLVRHELFHAIQYAYPAVANKRGQRERSYFEGMTTAAEDSTINMLVRDSTGVRKVDIGLFRGSARKYRDDQAYRAQDFFLYLGRRFNLDLSQLMIPMLEAGPTRQDVDEVLQSDPAYPAKYDLSEAYWDWAKNQAFEKDIDVGGGVLGVTCEFSPNSSGGFRARSSRGSGLPTIEFNYAVAQEDVGVSLPPLASEVVRIDLASLQDVPYSTQVRVTSSSDSIRTKFYDEADAGTTDCRSQAEGAQLDLNVTAGVNRTYHVLISNTSLEQSATATINFEPVADMEILKPRDGQTFQEGETIEFLALAGGVGENEVEGTIGWSHRIGDDSPFTFDQSQNGETVTFDRLCDGTYTITATALTADLGAHSDSITITVEDPEASDPPPQCAPTIRIDRPATDLETAEAFDLEEHIPLVAEVRDDDPDTPPLDSEITWHLDDPNSPAVAQGLNTSFPASGLEPGDHRIFARYRSALARARFIINEEPNSGPTANIQAPEDNADIAFQGQDDTEVQLEGHGLDPEDGRLTGDSLEWHYRNTGEWQFAGTGEELTVALPLNSCDVSTYQIRLWATDSAGERATHTHTIHLDAPPC